MRLVLLVGLAVTIALVPTVSSAPSDEMTLVPEWPEDFQQARSEPIRLLPGPPLREEASRAPLVPGSTTAGTSHSFDLVLENPDGSTGPAGDLALDPSRATVLDVYVSAGPTDDGLPADTPLEDGPGVAPSLTLEARLTVDGTTTPTQQLTQTVVATPEADTVARYRFTFDHGQQTLPAGGGLSVDLSVHQVNRSGEQVTQPQWRIHTDTSHPTGLTVPLAADQSSAGAGASLSLQGADEMPRETVRTGAYAALAAALLAAGWATVRGYRELREG